MKIINDYTALLLVFNEVDNALEKGTTLGDERTIRKALARSESTLKYLATADDEETLAFCNNLADERVEHNQPTNNESS